MTHAARLLCGIGLLSLSGCGSQGPTGHASNASGGSSDEQAGGAGGSSAGSSTTGGSAQAGGTSPGGGSGGSGGSSDTGGSASGGTGGVVLPNIPECDEVSGPVGTPPALVVGQWTNISPPGTYRPREASPPFGPMDVHSVRCAPYTLYVTTDIQGFWKSLDGGSTWNEVSNLPTDTSSGVMAVDPEDGSHLYLVGGVRGSTLGFWVSTDGGETFAQPQSFLDGADNSADGWTNDVYQVAADPADFQHLLLTFHSGFAFQSDAGILESTDGGESWKRHAPQAGWGAGSGISFLGDSGTWLLATQGGGYYRTSDAGESWTQVSTHNSMHGACIGSYSAAGDLYVGANNNIMRSTDNGLSFDLIEPGGQDGFYQVIGDGNFLYAQIANTGANTVGDQPYIVSPDGDGMNWEPYNEQTFTNGPYRMDFDATNRIIYSANFNEGVWALKVE